MTILYMPETIYPSLPLQKAYIQYAVRSTVNGMTSLEEVSVYIFIRTKMTSNVITITFNHAATKFGFILKSEV